MSVFICICTLLQLFHNLNEDFSRKFEQVDAEFKAAASLQGVAYVPLSKDPGDIASEAQRKEVATLHSEKEIKARADVDAILKGYLRLPSDYYDGKVVDPFPSTDGHRRSEIDPEECVHPQYLLSLCYLFKHGPGTQTKTDQHWPNRLMLHVLSAMLSSCTAKDTVKFEPLSNPVRFATAEEKADHRMAPEMHGFMHHPTWTLMLFKLAYDQILDYGYDPTVFDDGLIVKWTNDIVARITDRSGLYDWVHVLFLQLLALFLRNLPAGEVVPYGGVQHDFERLVKKFKQTKTVQAMNLLYTHNMRCAFNLRYLPIYLDKHERLCFYDKSRLDDGSPVPPELYKHAMKKMKEDEDETLKDKPMPKVFGLRALMGMDEMIYYLTEHMDQGSYDKQFPDGKGTFAEKQKRNKTKSKGKKRKTPSPAVSPPASDDEQDDGGDDGGDDEKDADFVEEKKSKKAKKESTKSKKTKKEGKKKKVHSLLSVPTFTVVLRRARVKERALKEKRQRRKTRMPMRMVMVNNIWKRKSRRRMMMKARQEQNRKQRMVVTLKRMRTRTLATSRKTRK